MVSLFFLRMFRPPVAQAKFNCEFDILNGDWNKIYSLPFRSCKEVKTNIFQYGNYMDCLMTNVRLFKMKLVEDESCSFCSNYPETMRHVLYDCEQVKQVLILFENRWESLIHVRLNLLGINCIWVQYRSSWPTFEPFGSFCLKL